MPVIVSYLSISIFNSSINKVCVSVHVGACVCSPWSSCFRPVSRIEAEVLLERYPDCGNMLLRPGRDGTSLAVTTRQDLNGYDAGLKHLTLISVAPYILDVIPFFLRASPTVRHFRISVIFFCFPATLTYALCFLNVLQLGVPTLSGYPEASGRLHH